MADMIEFTPIPEALKRFARGDLVVVMDDEDRENEGDLVLAAEHATAEKLAFILRYTTGIVCAPMLPPRADQLALPAMVAHNEDAKCTAFTVTCDAKLGITTGVSAADRAATLRCLADPGTVAADLSRPGHIFPLCARPGGVIERQGHTEAAVDLCRLAGLAPVGVICEMMDHADGGMMRLPACAAFAKEHGLPLITIEAMIEHIKTHCSDEPWVTGTTPVTESGDGDVYLAADCNLPIERRGQCLGMWRQCVFTNRRTGHTHVVLVKGEVAGQESVLARIHSECFTGDVLGSRRCDCGSQLDQAFRVIAQEGIGMVVYMGGHEGRGIGLANKTKAYRLQMEQGLDTYEANTALGLPHDLRSYDDARAIFRFLDVGAVELLTNNPLKVVELEGVVTKIRSLRCAANEHNAGYLTTKRAKETELKQKLALTSFLPCPSPPPSGPKAEPALRKEAPFLLPATNPNRASQLKIGVVRAAWNGEFVGMLWDGVQTAFLASGVTKEHIRETVVPGAYELPLAAQFVARNYDVDAILVIAILVQREAGNPIHFESAAQAVSQGIMQVQLSTNVPVLCGVLSCLSDEQVLSYISDPDDVPRSLALSTMQMAEMKRFDFQDDITCG